ncbi:endoribonuclease L-PSP family protein [Nitratireductor aquibiodomus RA22]|uniref:Endoribonuclease L-PSP family protein n=1 Tax=Nitratireductor aquibiodomus RA22 TaxID=1189611 RepID=I5C445_9HYPH|nr:RidA family protein [Nitratireductor aquibiodomus]EIM76597.1 endoribonuclease L-PSP family protein [Nitratireductor aquibiodomus RA22]
MQLKQIVTEPDPYAPYLLSQGIQAGNLVFVSGQAGYGDDGKIVKGDFLAQGRRAFKNLERALKSGGLRLSDIAKVTIFVTDMQKFDDVVTLRREFFSAPYPADSIVEIKALYTPQAMIEIEAIAVANA